VRGAHRLDVLGSHAFSGMRDVVQPSLVVAWGNMGPRPRSRGLDSPSRRRGHSSSLRPSTSRPPAKPPDRWSGLRRGPSRPPGPFRPWRVMWLGPDLVRIRPSLPKWHTRRETGPQSHGTPLESAGSPNGASIDVLGRVTMGQWDPSSTTNRSPPPCRLASDWRHGGRTLRDGRSAWRDVCGNTCS